MDRRSAKELGNKPLDELRKLLSENREALRELQFDLTAGKVKNVKRIHEIKKDIARTLTAMRKIVGQGQSHR